jgi:hypothetical protein
MKAVTGIILPPESCVDWPLEVWGSENWKYYHFWPLNVLPENTAQRLADRIAVLRKRAPHISIVSKKFSRTTKTEYWAAVCPICQSLQGAFPIHEERLGIIVSAASLVPMRENRTLIYRPWKDELTTDLLSAVYEYGETGHPYIDESWEATLDSSGYFIENFDDTEDVFHFTIGQPAPWENPASESHAFLLLNMSSGEIVSDNIVQDSENFDLQPAFLIWLDDDIDREISCLNNSCVAIGYYCSHEYPHGFPLFIFSHPRDMGQWAIKAPLISSKDNLIQWATNPTNSVWFFLMERSTKRLCATRQLTLPVSVKEHFIMSIRTNNEPPSSNAFNNFVGRYSEQAIWNSSLKWAWDSETDSFKSL